MILSSVSTVHSRERIVVGERGEENEANQPREELKGVQRETSVWMCIQTLESPAEGEEAIE